MLTTMAFGHSSLRWFEASSCKAASRGQTLIFWAVTHTLYKSALVAHYRYGIFNDSVKIKLKRKVRCHLLSELFQRCFQIFNSLSILFLLATKVSSLPSSISTFPSKTQPIERERLAEAMSPFIFPPGLSSVFPEH